MCGIAGYIGENEVLPFLINGLKRLEYRGYDSAGVGIFDGDQLVVRRRCGKIKELEKYIQDETIHGTVGIAHTRWATHGVPADCNAHPHSDKDLRFAVVHNGIIENYLELKEELEAAGCTFSSDTDSEVLPNLIAQYYDGDLRSAVQRAAKRLRGSYAAVFLCLDAPDQLVAVRQNSPLIVGAGRDGFYLASDIPALIGHADTYTVLENNECARLTRQGINIYRGEEDVTRPLLKLDMDLEAAEKGGYEHFMLKEICEQPRALRDCLGGRINGGKTVVNLGDIKLDQDKMATIKKIVMVACGTAYHACLVGKTVFEKLLRLPTEVAIASEFRYSDPLVDAETLTIVISQSGETADTLAALAEAQEKGSYALGITNVWESSVARNCDDVIYTRAGLEIAVASTKAYSTQLMAIYLLTLYMAELKKTLPRQEIKKIADELQRLPDKVENILAKQTDTIKKLGVHLASQENCFFIGRGLDYHVALEGALKLKEISYIHAEAYAAGELKHGTLALIVDKVPVVCLCTQEAVVDKMISNMMEVKARNAFVIAFAFAGNNQINSKAKNRVCYLPRTLDLLSPILTVVPLQLIAYYASVERGCDVDQPRNLAKSVTVE